MDLDEFGGDSPAATWSVEELAAATGMPVQTLHHYAEQGLVAPSLRHHGGQRRYIPADVRRLHRLTALQGLGFAPARIAGLLDDPTLDDRELVRRQLEQVRDTPVGADRLRARLTAVLDLLDDAQPPSATTLVRLMAEMTAAGESPPAQN